MSAQLTIRTFGGVTISLGEKPVTGLPSRKAEALLIYLAYSRRPLAREFLAELLWDERNPKQALANLRAVLSGLRRKLKPFLTVTRQTIAFNFESNYWLDTEELQQQAAAVLDKRPPGLSFSPAEAVRLQAALDLYGGSFLEGFFISESRGLDEWAMLQRERLQRLAVQGFKRLVQYYLDGGDYPAAEAQAARLLAIEPLNEAARRQMMLSLARQGRRSAALAQYENCRRLLAEELDVAPALQTTLLYRRIRTAEDTPRHNLFPAPTPFVGRTEELVRLQQYLLDPNCRLLTLLGPGGMGKTRLASEAGRQLLAGRPGAFLHGICFVSLTAVDSAAAMAMTLATALSMPFEGSREPADQLLTYLRQRELLLLLDNFEHLLENEASIDLVVRLLQEAPLVKILVTSRERLSLQEEWLYDVHGLNIPAVETTPEMVHNSDAVRLFINNASRMQPDFTPGETELQAIARVCRLLQGMPLGIELASAWVRQHSCREIADQIAADLDFLTTSLRNVPERHRSLRAVFDHSWRLLTAAEQEVVCRLAIFRGEIGHQAAAEVAAVSATGLVALVDKSFLRPAGENGRFEMHELLRQYAAEKLAEDPAAGERLWADYSRYFAGFLAEETGRLKGEEQREALQKVGRELENIRHVWETAVVQRDRALLAQMVNGVYWFHWQQGAIQEGHDLLARAAAVLLAEKLADDLLLARLQSGQAEFLSWLSEFEKADELLAASSAVLRRREAWPALARTLVARGNAAFYQGQYEQAQLHFEEALAVLQPVDEPLGMADALNSLAGVIAEGQADYEQASRLYQDSLALYRAAGDRFGQAKVIINLGVTAYTISDHEQARDYYREGIDLCRRLGHRQALAIALNNLGQVTLALGKIEEAAEYLQESVVLRRELGDRRGLGLTLKSLGDLESKAGRYDQAREHFAEALRIGRALPSAALLASTLISQAELQLREGQPARAAELLTVVAKDGPDSQENRNAIEALLAQIAEQLGSQEMAAARERAAGRKMADN